LFERKYIDLPFPNMERIKQGKKTQTNTPKQDGGGGEKREIAD
jgi:hypothetical protein